MKVISLGIFISIFLLIICFTMWLYLPKEICPILYIGDKSLQILKNKHQGGEVYAGNKDDFQYWNTKPIEGYIISTCHQLIFTQSQVDELIKKGRIFADFNGSKVLIKRTYKED